MPQSSAPDTPLRALLRERGGEFGAAITALARELEPRLDAMHRDALVELIRSWPMERDGTPRDADALYHRLSELRALPAALPPGVKAGSAAGGALGLIFGAVVGVPIGFLAFVLLAEFVLPHEVSSEGTMWVVIAAVTVLGSLIGFRNGASPSRGGRAAARGILGFVIGALLGAVTGVAVAGMLGSLLGVSQMEGAFAMGVVFVIAPLSGVAGGTLLGLWMARRAWLGWARSA